MPTYEYECLKCKKRFDQLQKMTEAPIKKCIFCHLYKIPNHKLQITNNIEI